MDTESDMVAGRKRKFEDYTLSHASNEPPLELYETPVNEKRKLEAKSANEIDDVFPTILPKLPKSSAAQARRNPERGYLCKRCAGIDLDTLLSRSHKTLAGQAAGSLTPIRDWKIHSCRLCHLLYSTLYKPSEWSSRVHLHTFSSNKMGEKTWSSISTNLLMLGNRRYIVSQPEGINGPVQLIKENIDSFDKVKTWINFCQSQHTKSCSIKKRSSIPGLKFIDCETKAIVAGGDYPYVALSYVWGEISETSADPNSLSENLPTTIEDAITVTKRLGYRYIWIDRYCIDQRNKEETAHQLGKMDLIYQNAEVTIIAAIGDGPNHGLPGVSQWKRAPEDLTTCAKIGKHFLISTHAWDKHSTTRGSKWETRAWTYQEALLSRRRLVFTREQMYFECHGMYCCESLDFSLERLHRKDKQGFRKIFCSKDRVGIFPRGVGTKPIEVAWRIEEYTKLNLSNSLDILKGMLGVFNAFQSRLSIAHYAGIPILPSMDTEGRQEATEKWTTSMGFVTGLLWKLGTIEWDPSEPKFRYARRHGFPSWCWTGWYGPVTYELPAPKINVDPSIRLAAQLIDGRILTLEDFQALPSQSKLHTQLSNIIYITAWTIEIKISGCRHDRHKDYYKTKLKLEDGGYSDWSFESAPGVNLSAGELCKGIILGQHDRNNPAIHLGYVILVCGKVGNTMERIGFHWLPKFDQKWSNANSSWEENFYGRGPDISFEPIKFAKSWEKVQLT